MSSGKSSSLPASMSNISTYLEKELKKPKFCVGPARARPGPILLSAVAAAVKVVTRSFPSKESRKTEAANKITNVMK